MPYDERLAERVRNELISRDGLTERKMFGGIAFMLHGNMCCGILQSDLIVRLGHEEAQRALREEAHTRLMDFTGRPMRGMVIVGSDGLDSDQALREWVDRAAQFVSTLPPK